MSDIALYQGVKGLFNTGQWNTPLANLSFQGRYDIKQDIFSSHWVYDREGGIYWNPAQFSRVKATYRENEYSSYPVGGKQKGFVFSASQEIQNSDGFLPSSYLIEFSPNQVQLDGRTYSNNRFSFGLQRHLFGFALGADYTDESNSLIFSGQPEPRSSLGVRATSFKPLQWALGDVVISADGTGRFVHYLKSGAYDYDMAEGSLQLTLRHPFWGEAYAKYAQTRFFHLTSVNLNHDEQFSFGFQRSLDTGINWAVPPRFFQGTVFEDRNQNGVRDSNENGLSEFSFQTDKDGLLPIELDGSYRFQDIASHYVTLVSTTKAHFHVLGNNPSMMVYGKDNQCHMDFPISFSKKLTVVTFLDGNDDGVYSPGEQLVNNTRFFLSQGKQTVAVDNLTGQIEISVWGRDGNPTLDFDVNSLSPELTPASTLDLHQVIDLGSNQTVYAIPVKVSL